MRKLQGSTEYSFTTSLKLDEVAATIEKIVTAFAKEHSEVQSFSVNLEGSAIQVVLVISSKSFEAADNTMADLSDALRRHLTSLAETLDVEERMTELVPA